MWLAGGSGADLVNLSFPGVHEGSVRGVPFRKASARTSAGPELQFNQSVPFFKYCILFYFSFALLFTYDFSFIFYFQL